MIRRRRVARESAVWPDTDAADPRGPEPIGVDTRPTRSRRRVSLVVGLLALGSGLIVSEAGWLVLVGHAAPARAAPVSWVALSPTTAQDPAVGQPRAAGAAVGTGTTESGHRIGAGAAQAAVAAWADRLGPLVAIPVVALEAYGAADLELARQDPGCHLSWVDLAGIGEVESDHGRYGGAVLAADGRSVPPIIGVVLDGRGVALQPDTDGGRLDGDPLHDRAVGPMQFLPSTWQRWAADGDGDGIQDPFDISDAALAAGRYLCASGGGDLRTSSAWSAAVLAYNHSAGYLDAVTRQADGYAVASVLG